MDFTKSAENLMGVRIIRSNFYSPVRKKKVGLIMSFVAGGGWPCSLPSITWKVSALDEKARTHRI